MKGLFLGQSKYSIGKSLLEIDDIFMYAKNHNLDYVCVADTKLHALYKMLQAAKDYSFKLVLGLNVELEYEENTFELALMALDSKGLNNLIKLSTVTQFRKLTINDLKVFQKSVIIISKQALKVDDLKIYEYNFNKYTHLTNDDQKALAILLKIGGFDIKDHMALDNLQQPPSMITELIKEVQNYQYAPDFSLPAHPEINLKELAIKGLKRRLSAIPDANIKVYQARLLHELNVIAQFNFENYFLTVYDYVLYAKKNAIFVGAGRGSVCASLLAYCLGITEVDPIKHELLFERFLNPMRVSMPDIDLDFADEKRDQILNYLANKYGNRFVATMSTFVEFRAKSALNDVIKYLDVPKSRQVALTNSIIRNRFDPSDRLALDAKESANKLEGKIRQTSTHPAGIILANEDLTNYIPFQKGAHSELNQTQFEASDIESLGLVKFDILGLRNLTIISKILSKIPNALDLNKLPLNNKKAYQLINAGYTTGIFQFETPSFKRILKSFKVNTFNDIVALLALNRPGPIQFILDYVKRQKGENEVDYIDESIKDILVPTYGIIIYQEQIMQILQVFAGFSLAQADIFRRAISKKSEEAILSLEAQFIEKSLKLGRSEQSAKRIYEIILKFADYGFNKAHSIGYALLVYQMAYLKANYPLEFVVSSLDYQRSDKAVVSEYLKYAQSLGFEILPPTLQYLENEFKVEDGKIRIPLILINKVTTTIVEKLKNLDLSKVETFEDFVVSSKDILNQEVLTNMIYGNCFQNYSTNHNYLLNNIDAKAIVYRQFIVDANVAVYNDLTFEEKKANELNAYGINIFYEANLEIQKLRQLNKSPILKKQKNSKRYIKIVDMKEMINKAGGLMARISAVDGFGKLSMVMFSKEYNIYKNKLILDVVLEVVIDDGSNWIIKKVI